MGQWQLEREARVNWRLQEFEFKIEGELQLAMELEGGSDQWKKWPV